MDFLQTTMAGTEVYSYHLVKELQYNRGIADICLLQGLRMTLDDVAIRYMMRYMYWYRS